MKGRRMRCGVAAIAALSAWCCGRSPITAGRIEPAIERTFANLVETQVARLQLEPRRAEQFDVTASCRRLAGGTEAGAGEWVCRLRWLGAERQSLVDTFDLWVTTDGCYTATAEGERRSGPTLEGTDGREVRNLLYAFEGCFDTM